MQSFHNVISTILQPAITLVAGLFFSIYISFQSLSSIFFWFILLAGICFISTGIGYGWLLVKEKADPDVKNIKQRIKLFFISVSSFGVATTVSFVLTDATALQHLLLAGTLLNALYTIILLMQPFELSVHVGVYLVLVLFLVQYTAFWIIVPGIIILFLLSWSRYALRQHTIAELIGGIFASTAIYFLVSLVL